MFSSLSQNSILYILDLKSDKKIIACPIERVSIPSPKYNTLNPTMEMVVDIIATVNGERREFKGVPNTSIANFGEDAFVLADTKESLNSYINAMLQNSENIINSIDKHKKLVANYKIALEELNPEIKVNAEKDKAIKNLQDEIGELKSMILSLTKGDNNKT